MPAKHTDGAMPGTVLGLLLSMTGACGASGMDAAASGSNPLLDPHLLRLVSRDWRDQVDASTQSMVAPRLWGHSVPSCLLQRLRGLRQVGGLLLGSPDMAGAVVASLAGACSLQSLSLGLGGGAVAEDALQPLASFASGCGTLTSLQLLGGDFPTGAPVASPLIWPMPPAPLNACRPPVLLPPSLDAPHPPPWPRRR